MRLSGLVLLVTAVFHLIYMQFIIPGGVMAINYHVIAARWTDPTWGFFWRFFDLMLLVFGITHGGNGIRQIIESYISSQKWRRVVKSMLYASCCILAGLGATVIFSFRILN
jgi:succinate dehydrogenase / fumarate reductase membrane anchor subunit